MRGTSAGTEAVNLPVVVRNFRPLSCRRIVAALKKKSHGSDLEAAAAARGPCTCAPSALRLVARQQPTSIMMGPLAFSGKLLGFEPDLT